MEGAEINKSLLALNELELLTMTRVIFLSEAVN